ncbi:MAG: 50S ribosomal protein L6 [Acidobacteriota bacterium]|nr:50S ribosomal protein L6 [Acidobacteriota bacterium]
MSRVGKRPIPIPSGVTVEITPEAVEVKGPKGSLRQPLPPGVLIEMNDGKLQARLERDDRALSKFHGLGRSLVANAVTGVSEGFKKELDIVGIGYRAEVVGQRLTFALGYSHPVIFDIPEGVGVSVDNQTHLVVSGADRQQVGQVAADIRSLRKPDPYKQKGIRYTGEVLKKKVGKTGA